VHFGTTIKRAMPQIKYAPAKIHEYALIFISVLVA
jgi:hypothetical protein